jgi:hypothetical protein
MTVDDLSAKLDAYHGDVKEILNRHDVAINGIPGDDTCPGLNLEVQGLRAFRERVRLGVGAAWAAILTGATILWSKK